MSWWDHIVEFSSRVDWQFMLVCYITGRVTLISWRQR